MNQAGGRPWRRWLGAALLVLTAAGTGCRSAAVIDRGAIADAQIAARVKTALVNDPQLGIRPIEVSVTGCVARLSGRMPTQAEIDRAIAIARAVAGVTDVRSALLLGADPAPVQDLPAAPALPDIGDFEVQPRSGLLALGLAAGGTSPRSGQLAARTTVGPLLRIGRGRGLGLAIGFNWYKADYTSLGDGGISLARVSVRPVMAGLGYAVGSDRVTVSPSLVAGYAFNSLSVAEHGTTVGALAVDVDNSLVWRPGASLWIDATPRVALHVSGGYLMTGLDFTVFQNGRLSRRQVKGDTLQLHAGVAYKIF